MGGYNLPYQDGVPDVDDVSLSLLDVDATQAIDSTASASSTTDLQVDETSGSDSTANSAIDAAAEAFVDSEENQSNLEGDKQPLLSGIKSGYPYED